MGPIEKRALKLLLEASCGAQLTTAVAMAHGCSIDTLMDFHGRGWIDDNGCITEIGRRRVGVVAAAWRLADSIANDESEQRELPLGGTDETGDDG